MSLILPLLGLAVAAQPAKGLDQPASLDAIAVFKDVCVKGSGRFRAGSVRPVSPARVPSQVRKEVGSLVNATVLETSTNSPRMVIAVDRSTGGKAISCSVFVEKLPTRRLKEVGFDVPEHTGEFAWERYSPDGFNLKAKVMGVRGMLLSLYPISDARMEEVKNAGAVVIDPNASSKTKAAARQILEKGTH